MVSRNAEHGLSAATLVLANLGQFLIVHHEFHGVSRLLPVGYVEAGTGQWAGVIRRTQPEVSSVQRRNDKVTVGIGGSQAETTRQGLFRRAGKLHDATGRKGELQTNIATRYSQTLGTYVTGHGKARPIKDIIRIDVIRRASVKDDPVAQHP